MKIFPIVSLVFTGCVTPTFTKPALLEDERGHRLANSPVKIQGSEPKFSLAPSTGKIYTETITDKVGRFKLTAPTYKKWFLNVRTKTRDYDQLSTQDKNDYLLIVVKPRAVPWKSPTTPSSESLRAKVQ